MEYYEITYRVRYLVTGKKYVAASLGRTDAITKTRLSSDRILSVKEISKEDFITARKAKHKEIER